MIRQDKFRSTIGLLSLCAVFGATQNTVQAASVVSSTHPDAVYYGFNSGAAPFEAFAVPGGVASGARFVMENGALKMTNAFAGSFSVDTKIKPFNADKYKHLFFDYKLTPDVKVNLFFRVNRKFYGVTFSGPNRVRPGSILLGKIEGVKADNQWHRAHIPLRDWLRESDPLATTLDVDIAVFGNWDNDGWLMAGMGGNGPGASWWVDNFALVGAGPGEAKFELRDDDGKALPNPPAAHWTLDGKKVGEGATVATAATDGFHLVEARDANGKLWAAYPIFAAPGAPKIGVARMDGDLIRIPIAAPGGLNLSDLKLTLNGKDYGITSKFLQWNGEELAFDAGAAGMQWKDGAQVSLALNGVQDEQKRAATAWQGNLAVSYATHKAAPGLPHVQIEGVAAPPPRPQLRNTEMVQPVAPVPIFGAGDGTFEESMDEWRNYADSDDDIAEGRAQDAQLDRDNGTAAKGNYSLRLTCPKNGVRFWATIRTSGFDAAKIPVISFDYKVPPQLRADFMLLFDGVTYSIQFTDKDNPAPRIGSVPTVIADNQWHHAEFNLGAMLREIKPDRAEYRVDSLFIGDGGWMGNARGVQYWLDNFQFVPLVKATPLQATVAVDDVTGVKGVSWVLDENPKTPVPEQVKASTNKIELTGTGRKWLHVRAQNGAGEWSPALDVPLWLSEGAPKVAVNDISPPNGAHIVPAALEIPLRAEGGIKSETIKLTVAGHEFDTKDNALTYNKEASKIIWDAAQALISGNMKVPENGARVDWKLAPVTDFLGIAAEPAEGHWINDFAADKSGPRVILSSDTHALYFFDDGEGDLQWSAGEGSKVGKVERENGGHAARFTTATAGAAFVVDANLPQASVWDPRKYGLISFDYKLPPEANVTLRLRFSNGRSWPLNFAGEKSERSIGTIPDIVADGKWHTATFNLGDFLERDRSSRNSTITGFGFTDAAMKTPANVSWELDNFLIQQAGGKEAKLSWRAQDLSGVKAYRVAWNQLPNTEPTEAATETSRTVQAESGLYYMHLQAQDGAGNWGPVAHVPVALSEKSSSTVANPFSGGLIFR